MIKRSFVIISLLALAAVPAVLAQQSHSPTVASVMGTYGLGTKHSPSPSRDGCWLEVAPSDSNSVRVQVRCTMPAPSHHIGVLDQGLPLTNGVAAYQMNRYGGTCLIVIRFENATAVVYQKGGAADCGFGANVNIAGTYRRISRQRPPLDLAPIEKSSERR